MHCIAKFILTKWNEILHIIFKVNLDSYKNVSFDVILEQIEINALTILIE